MRLMSMFSQPIAHFSSSSKPDGSATSPQEYTVNEEEIFGEKKMAEAQKSIGEKLNIYKESDTALSGEFGQKLVWSSQIFNYYNMSL